MRAFLTGPLVVVALLSGSCGDDPGATAADGDCVARLSVDGEVLDPVGADPTGRRGSARRVDVVGCDETPVERVSARPVVRDGETLGYLVARGSYRGFYSTESLVEPVE